MRPRWDVWCVAFIRKDAHTFWLIKEICAAQQASASGAAIVARILNSSRSWSPHRRRRRLKELSDD